MIKVVRRSWAAVVLLTVMVGAMVNTSLPASASVTCTNDHCYSILRGTGKTFYGMYGTWGRSAMNAPGANSANYYFVDSEMWASPSTTTNAWVETGLTQGYFAVPNKVGYYAFGAYKKTSGGYAEHNFGMVTQSTGVTDEHQISRNGTTNKWNVYFNGALWTTPTVGFWKTDCLDVGGEVFANKGTASKFTMYVKGITSSGGKSNLSTQTRSVDSGLNGSSPANSSWTWSIK